MARLPSRVSPDSYGDHSLLEPWRIWRMDALEPIRFNGSSPVSMSTTTTHFWRNLISRCYFP